MSDIHCCGVSGGGGDSVGGRRQYILFISIVKKELHCKLYASKFSAVFYSFRRAKSMFQYIFIGLSYCIDDGVSLDDHFSVLLCVIIVCVHKMCTNLDNVWLY